MFKNKLTTFIRILVLAVYTFHGVAPLLYSIERAEAAVQAEGPADIDVTESRPAGAVQRSLSLMRCAADDDSQVFLKKRRALPASSKSLIEQLSQFYPALSPLAPVDETAGIPVCPTDDLPICPNGFQFYHSGISPPSV